MPFEPEEWIILGVTVDGKRFRPSDWAERLCNTVSAFLNTSTRIYSSYVLPISRAGVPAVRVDNVLKELHPAAYDFVMDFARENRLMKECGRGRMRREAEDAA
jgi:hypothetical protein